MSDYYVGESLPPPLPPPRRSSSSQDDNDPQYDYESVIANALPPPLPPPNVTQHKYKPPPPLPKKSASVSSDIDPAQLSPSKINRLSALGSSLQDSIKPFLSSKSKKPSSKRDLPPSPKRMSSYDASSYSPRAPYPLPITPPISRRAPLPPPPPQPPTQPPPPTTTDDDNYDGEDYEDVELPNQFYLESHPSDGITLLQFINQNQAHFPVPFEVSLGFSACSEEASISEGESFIANFLKRNKVLTVEDDSKELYTIPLNTSFQFALLHDPNANKKEAMAGFVFKSAGDLMITRSLPKVVRARKAFRGVSPESSVSANELLYVKEVVQKEANRRYVKCVQVSTGKEKQLHEECLGEFSTLPHDIRDYLPNLLKHFQLPFRAVMCLGVDNEEDIPPHLVSAIVTVSNLRTEESLIATTVSDDIENGECVVPDTKTITLNDIPLSYDINVKPLNVTPLNAEKIIEQTDYIFQNFNPSNVFPYLANHSSSQLALMKSVRKDVNMIGVELIESKIISKHRAKKVVTESTSADSVDMSKIHARLNSLDAQIESLTKNMGDILTKISLQEQVILSLKQAQTQRQSSASTSDERSLSNGDECVAVNKRFLTTLGVEQMTDLLSAMNLSQYNDIFQTEQISGELLLELTEEILEHDLSISGKLHRMRLMKLINGQHSAEGYLKGEGPYVKMTKS